MENAVLERIKSIKKKENLTNESFSERTKIPVDTIKSMFSKGTNPGLDTLVKINSAFPLYTIDWIVTGHLPSRINIENTEADIPLYKTSASAGFGSSSFSVEKKDIEGYYRIKEFNSANFMHYISGDSMSPTYASGDIVAVKILYNKEDIQWGKAHLISTPDGLLVKRLYENGGRLVAVSDNPSYYPRFYRWEDVGGVAIILGCVKIEGL